jgi:hypothetical protein
MNLFLKVLISALALRDAGISFGAVEKRNPGAKPGFGNR